MHRSSARRRRQERMFALAAGALVLMAAACSRDSSDASHGATVAPAAGTPRPGAAFPAVEIIATDYAFDLGGATIPAGQVALTLANEGAEDHQLSLVRVDDGVAVGDVVAGLLAGDTSVLAGTTAVGGPNGVTPGGRGTTTADLTPGTYVMVCHIPSPGDGRSHAAKGMVGSFTVEGVAASAAPVPDVKGTITIGAGGYSLPAGLGSGRYLVVNDLDQPAEAAVVRLRQGASAGDVLAFLGGHGNPGPPPFSSAGGVTNLSPRSGAVADLDLPAGSYAFISFSPDLASGGRPQFLSGLLTEVAVP